jgi:bacterioferritin B
VPSPLAPPDGSAFVSLLREQVQHEFAASQQYVGLAVWFDARDLPRLAAHFYRQAVEERNHAMMLVQYMLDRDIGVQIPGIPEVLNEFSKPVELIALSLQQEQKVTQQIEALFKAARGEDDFLSEQSMLWFLKEQVEEVSSMSTLLAVAERAGDDVWQIEDFLARESVGDAGQDPSAPAAAGGAL